ncbi:putative -like family protein [Neofusicoccum parvum UCRNP2]|uniref:Putative-like family protein n=1 Tax=Botryosphaeria parva (strain UCR-NP2) TaxID=1287680 RepID=R1EMP6_BOTPV|nr:putative -like family protein [Neofusicoccum parvum UCRNP2]
MPKLVITGASGKLGGAVLRNLLSYHLLPPHEIVVTTSSSPGDPRLDQIKARGVTVSSASYDDKQSMEAAFADCERLLLVSTPRISMDFDDAPYGHGREAHHFAAIDAARAAGVKHIYYTSLGFAAHSKAGVMRAHNRTEEFLRMLSDTGYTIIREGLYNESWPLYLGHGDLSGQDDRGEVVVAGDGRISWAAIDDLGLATACILVDQPSGYAGVTLTLSTTTSATLQGVASMVSAAKGRQINLKVVGRDEHEKFYIEQRGIGPGYARWWSTTYDALRDNECENKDTTLERLLAKHGRKPKPLQETITEMVGR